MDFGLGYIGVGIGAGLAILGAGQTYRSCQKALAALSYRLRSLQ